MSDESDLSDGAAGGCGGGGGGVASYQSSLRWSESSGGDEHLRWKRSRSAESEVGPGPTPESPPGAAEAGSAQIQNMSQALVLLLDMP